MFRFGMTPQAYGCMGLVLVRMPVRYLYNIILVSILILTKGTSLGGVGPCLDLIHTWFVPCSDLVWTWSEPGMVGYGLYPYWYDLGPGSV